MKHLFLVCAILLSMASHAAVFTVTSTADSGPGTFRDALELANANGTGETDYIYFNLPGASSAQHIITLTKALPPLTGNLVIDGTSQAGDSYGLSNAKVTICYQLTDGSFLKGIDLSNATGVKLFGFF